MLSTYSVCFQARGEELPGVEWVDAENDDDAIRAASVIQVSTMRELWQCERLVARLNPDRLSRRDQMLRLN